MQREFHWLFVWTESGAKHIGIFQSLLMTCRLHEIDLYDYLLEVRQRVNQHLASMVRQLTRHLWKQLYANNPLLSDLHDTHINKADWLPYASTAQFSKKSTFTFS